VPKRAPLLLLFCDDLFLVLGEDEATEITLLNKASNILSNFANKGKIRNIYAKPHLNIWSPLKQKTPFSPSQRSC